MKYSKRYLAAFFLLAAPLVSALAYTTADVFEGNMYLAGTNPPQLIFTHENSRTVSGDSETLTHTYRDVDGNVATVETVTLRSGQVERYEVRFLTSDCGCLLERNGNSMTFTSTQGNDLKTATRPYEAGIVTGPTLNLFIVNQWQALMSDEAVPFYLPAMPLRQIVKFTLVRDRKSIYEREGTVVVKMDVANPVFRLFVEPVRLVLESETGRLLEIHGKSLLERIVNGKKENPVIDAYYTYPKE